MALVLGTDADVFICLGKEYTSVTGERVSASPEDEKTLVDNAKWFDRNLVATHNGKVEPVPVMILEGGLEAIPDALDQLKEGSVSAQKIVVRL